MSISAYFQSLFLANYTDANGPQAISDFGPEAIAELKNFGKLAKLSKGVVGLTAPHFLLFRVRNGLWKPLRRR